MDSGKYLYAVEKLGVAVYALVGTGEIQDRLYEACKSILPLQPRDLPEHLRGEFTELKQALTWIPPEQEGEGTLLATLRAMSDEEADRLAKKFYELYDQVHAASYDA
jgi:hypothetical protein